MSPSVSVVVITFNEEANLRECLESVAWADEIVVVDSGSTDRTIDIAKEFTEKVIHNPWPGYAAQKQIALDAATETWVVSLDADERCTPKLRDAILEGIANPGDAAGFEVRRHVWYLGRWIDHGGWYPDWKLRVVRREQAHWEGKEPHDNLMVNGPIRRLDAEIIHYTYEDFAHQIRTVNRFSDAAAAEWQKEGKRFSILRAIFHPQVKFIEFYIWKGGFLDGWAGFVIAVATSFYVFAKYVKLWELERSEKKD